MYAYGLISKRGTHVAMTDLPTFKRHAALSKELRGPTPRLLAVVSGGMFLWNDRRWIERHQSFLGEVARGIAEVRLWSRVPQLSADFMTRIRVAEMFQWSSCCKEVFENCSLCLRTMHTSCTAAVASSQ